MDVRKAAVPLVIFAGATLLAGCGDSTSGDGDDMESTMEATMEATTGA
ncbi:hypothetical protein [Demequina sp. NBRC 110056]|nr:hypothetical protein [Demequina sp. NBRC 110056]